MSVNIDIDYRMSEVIGKTVTKHQAEQLRTLAEKILLSSNSEPLSREVFGEIWDNPEDEAWSEVLVNMPEMNT